MKAQEPARTVSLPFDHKVKLDRAWEHLEDLRGKAARWFGGDHHRLRIEPDPDDNDFVFVMLSADRPPPDLFSVVIGDCLHGFRSALDALAYELASAHTKPLTDEIAEQSEFPIFGNSDGKGAQRFANGGRRKIRGIHPDAQAIIETLQPYHKGDWGTFPLWVLHDLDRIKKHRLLHSVVAATSAASVDESGLRRFLMQEGKAALKARGLEHAPGATASALFHVTVMVGVLDSEAAEIPVLRLPKSFVPDDVEVDMYFRPELVMTLTPPPVHNDELLDVLLLLDEIHRYIRGEVVGRLERFLT